MQNDTPINDNWPDQIELSVDGFTQVYQGKRIGGVAVIAIHSGYGIVWPSACAAIFVKPDLDRPLSDFIGAAEEIDASVNFEAIESGIAAGEIDGLPYDIQDLIMRIIEQHFGGKFGIENTNAQRDKAIIQKYQKQASGIGA